ncbi:N/A [soil metagenome]
MPYQEYDAENFAMDEYFQKWVKYPDAASDLFWQSWITENPEKKDIIEKAIKLVWAVDMEAEELPEFEVQQLWENIKQEVKNDAAQPTIEHVYISTVSKKINWLKYAAVFIGIILTSSLVWFYINMNQIVVKTGYGQTFMVLLPDSSTAILNSNSRLRYKKDWSESTSREVWLEGEAYFTVLKKKNVGNTKFIVHADEINVEVIGTEFNVNNRHGIAKVVLNSGKIKINVSEAINTDGLVMEPGELVEFNQQNKTLEIREVNPGNYISWKNKMLKFDNTTLEEIAIIIKDNYGFEVITSKEITKRKLTGEVEVSNVDDLISAISESLGLKITKKDYKIIIEE